MRIYADNAATTRMSRSAIDAMVECMEKEFGNPSSLYGIGQRAKELLDQGTAVIYFSSSDLFRQLSDYAFDYNSKSELENLCDYLYNCELLIIDDLGTELTNSFVIAQLFTILNERDLRHRSTIISTNLSLQEIHGRYQDRVFSRIMSHFQLLKLTGSDIRLQKAKR